MGIEDIDALSLRSFGGFINDGRSSAFLASRGKSAGEDLICENVSSATSSWMTRLTRSVVNLANYPTMRHNPTEAGKITPTRDVNDGPDKNDE